MTLSDTNLSKTELYEIELCETKLHEIRLCKAELHETELLKNGTEVCEIELYETKLCDIDLCDTKQYETDFFLVHFISCSMSWSYFFGERKKFFFPASYQSLPICLHAIPIVCFD